MRTAKVLLFSVFVLVAAGLPCYGDYQEATDNDRVFEGKVVNVNIAQSTLTVNNTIDMTFVVSSDTKLTHDIDDIGLSDIEKGDYVSVGYERSAETLTAPIKAKDVVLEYDDSKERK